MRRRPTPLLALAWALLALAATAAHAEVRIHNDLDLGELASCVSDSGALYYGAHWCPMCRKQNAYFEGYSDALPYVECYDGPKSWGMNETCRSEDVKAFPTWIFGDGSVRRGALSPLALASATGCLDR